MLIFLLHLFCHLSIRVKPVSYTHLDVYKRQGIGLVDLLVCPHYNLDGREEELERIMKRTKDVQGVGLKNLQALKIIDGDISIISDSNDDKVKFIN